ncbi:MAG: MobF family relaxase [Pseudomonadota bacterium]
MLRLSKSRSARAAAEYFRTALNRSDYYTRDVTGRWHGLGAARLGLAGDVSADTFLALLQNRAPDGSKLTPRDKADRVPGIDFTISAPKSVSLLWAVSEDRRFVEAHERAEEAMMAEIEAHLETRVRRGGKAHSEEVRKTGNAVWASFLHDTARPVDGIPDPQLHTHCYLVNATFDPVESRFKAAQIGNIAADRVYFEAVYHAHLAKEIRALGFEIERRGKWWDVAGIDRALLEKFSRRTGEVEAAAAEAGALSAAQKAELGKRTRSVKAEAIPSDALHGVWRSRLHRGERAALDRILRVLKDQRHSRGHRVGVVEAWRFALAKGLERHSLANEKRVLADALQYGLGDVSLADLAAARDMTTLIRGEVDGRAVITTPEVLAEEDRMIASARRGRLGCAALGSGDYRLSNPRLNDGQRAAITQIWESRDRVMVLRGGAGVGKTKGVLAEAVAGLAAAGHAIYGYGATGAATDELREAVARNAETVARLLCDPTQWERMRGGVVVIDEASLLGVRDMGRLLALAEQHDWRLILCGDEKQHGGVARGDAFRLLRERAGIKTAELRQIVRQKGDYREAVAAIERGDIAEGWERFAALDAIVEAPDERRFEAIAEDYAAETAANRSVLVVAPTHSEKDAVTAHIRKHLRAEGRLGDAEHRILRLTETRWTEAERGDARLYQPGQVVKFFQHVGPIRRGERLEVIAIVEGVPQLSNGMPLPLNRAQHYRVYDQGALRLSRGDLVRITEGAKTEDGRALRTGSVHRVDQLTTGGRIVLEGGATLGPSFGLLDHGYCSTSHASQGRTVDVVLASMGRRSLPATSLEQFYVTVSRGRHTARIYTDDREAVAEASRRTSHRGSAREFVDGQIDAGLRPYRLARFESFAERLAWQATRIAKERGRELTVDAALMAEAKQLAAATHRGRVTARDRGPSLGD